MFSKKTKNANKSSEFSVFIREARSSDKKKVYKRVINEAIESQGRRVRHGGRPLIDINCRLGFARAKVQVAEVVHHQRVAVFTHPTGQDRRRQMPQEMHPGATALVTGNIDNRIDYGATQQPFQSEA